MNRKLRIGIIGTANIAAKAVIPTLLKLNSHYKVIGVAGRDFENTQKFCEVFSIKAFKSYYDLISLDNIDVLYIPLPNALHFEWVSYALNRGIHVMCEKSLGVNLDEVELMVETARKNSLLLMEHFQFRFHSQLKFITNLINEIGELRVIRSTFGIPPFSNISDIRYSKKLGGGALLDNGAYPAKLAQMLLKGTIKVESCVLNFEKYDVDIWGSFSLLDTDCGVSFQGAFGFDHVYRCDLEVIGSKGRITTDRVYTAPLSHKPIICFEKQVGYNITKKDFLLDEDDHFSNIWIYFYESVICNSNFENEYSEVLKQAIIINDLKNNVNVK